MTSSITIDLLQLNIAQAPLNKLAAFSFPFKTAYDVKKRLKVLRSEIEIMQEIIDEKRKEKFLVLEEYENVDQKDEKKFMEKLKIHAKLEEEFKIEMMNLFKSKIIELKDFKPLKIEDLGNIEMTPDEVEMLSFMFEDPKDASATECKGEHKEQI